MLAMVGCGKDSTEGNVPPTPVNPDAAAPVMKRFVIDKRNNEGLAGSVTCRIDEQTKQITGSVKGYTPMLAGSCTFVPTFEVPENHKVYAGERMLTSGVSRVDLSQPATFRVVNENGDEAAYIVELEFSFTDLPVVAIDTWGGHEIASKDRWVSASIAIDGNGDYEDLAQTEIEISGRGNSTWGYPKKPYKFKFDKRTEVLGMPKHKRWVLLANYNDRTMLRNDVAFHLGRMTDLAWTPRGVFVEVVLNNRHVGNYYLCEQIRIDENRLDITEMDPYAELGEGADITGGYLLELDSYYDEVNKFLSAVQSLPVNVKAPDADDLGTPQMNYIRDYFNEAERALYGEDWLDPEKGYKKYIDMESFADMYLVAELVYHYEWRHPKSTYMYKDRGGKLCMGPMWDYDWRCFTVEQGWYARDQLWYPRLLEDPEFVALVKSRWATLYPKFSTTASYISRMRSKLAASAALNWGMWSNDAGENDDNNMEYSAAVNLMQSRFSARLEWLNGAIGEL